MINLQIFLNKNIGITPDVNKQNHWRTKPSFLSHHYGDQCVFLLGS